MAHGTPDWGLVGPKRTTYGLDDLGELAVRLGSPHTWDRRGDVLVWSDFRNGFGGIEGIYDIAPAHVDLVTGHARQGAYSVEPFTRAVVNSFAGVRMCLPLPVDSACGLEFCFSCPEEDVYWDMRLHWRDPADQWQSRIRLDVAGWPLCQLEYYDDTGNYQAFEDPIMIYASEQPMHVLKMVVDMGRHEYVRVILNEREFDLRGIGIRDAGGGGAVNMVGYILLYTQTPDVRSAYLDCVMITENEPT